MIKLIRKPRLKRRRPAGLALSGGGARGAIHLGVLQSIEDRGIEIEAVSGTSIGAIIGVLYCAGKKPAEIKEMFNTKTFRKVFRLSWSKKGLLKMDSLIKLLESLTNVRGFDELDKKFYCCVSNLNKGDYEIINSGDLFRSVAASASIPLLFEPVILNGEYYIDGGLFNNLPVEPLVNEGYDLIGVHVNNYKQNEEITAKTAAERIFTHVINMNIKSKLEMCNVVIDPYIPRHVGVLDFSATEFLYRLGYEAAEAAFEKKNLIL